MQISLTRAEIQALSEQRDRAQTLKYLAQEVQLTNRMAEASTRGHITKEDLIATAAWKWRGARTQQLCDKNTPDEVKEISRLSFASSLERLRIGALLSLDGVGWPMASVILHFVFPDRYPILDVWAMKSVGGSRRYSLQGWLEYSELCRKTAKEHGVSLRTLDKALWFSGKPPSR